MRHVRLWGSGYLFPTSASWDKKPPWEARDNWSLVWVFCFSVVLKEKKRKKNGKGKSISTKLVSFSIYSTDIQPISEACFSLSFFSRLHAPSPENRCTYNWETLNYLKKCSLRKAVIKTLSYFPTYQQGEGSGTQTEQERPFHQQALSARPQSFSQEVGSGGSEMERLKAEGFQPKVTLSGAHRTCEGTLDVSSFLNKSSLMYSNFRVKKW